MQNNILLQTIIPSRRPSDSSLQPINLLLCCFVFQSIVHCKFSANKKVFKVFKRFIFVRRSEPFWGLYQKTSTGRPGTGVSLSLPASRSCSCSLFTHFVVINSKISHISISAVHTVFIAANFVYRKSQIPLRCPGCRQVRSWSQTCSELEFGLSSSSELARASRSATGLRPASDLSATRMA